MSTKTIFVNYRREDTSGHAGRLFDRLNKHFGSRSVFWDVSGSIEHGEPFDKAIERAVASCDVFLAVIGHKWLSSTDTTGKRRLDDPSDYVRLEIAKALERQIRVIPVLVQRVTMPSAEDLPQDLKPLAKHQAIELSDNRWDYDISQLIITIEKILKPRVPLWAKAAAAILLLAAVGFGIWTFWPKPNPGSQRGDTNTSVLDPVTDSVPAKRFDIKLNQAITEIRGNIYFYLNMERLPDINSRAVYKENPGVVHVFIAVMRDQEMVGEFREVIYSTSEGNICNIADLPETTGHLKRMKVAYSIGLRECLQPEGNCIANLDPNGKKVTIILKSFIVTIGKDCIDLPLATRRF